MSKLGMSFVLSVEEVEKDKGNGLDPEGGGEGIWVGGWDYRDGDWNVARDLGDSCGMKRKLYLIRML